MERLCHARGDHETAAPGCSAADCGWSSATPARSRGPSRCRCSAPSLYGATAVAATVVLGRVTQDVILPAFDHGVDGGTVIGAAVRPGRHRRDPGRVDRAAPLLRGHDPVPRPGPLAASHHRHLPRRPVDLSPEPPDRSAARPHRQRRAGRHRGAEPVPVHPRGAGPGRVRPDQPGPGRHLDGGAVAAVLPDPRSVEPGLHPPDRAAGRAGAGAGGPGVEDRPREHRRRAGGQDPRTQPARGRPAVRRGR